MFMNKITNLHKKNNLDKNLKINLIKSHIFMTKGNQLIYLVYETY